MGQGTVVLRVIIRFVIITRMGRGLHPRRSSFFIEGMFRVSLAARKRFNNETGQQDGLSPPVKNSVKMWRFSEGEMAREEEEWVGERGMMKQQPQQRKPV